MKTAAAPFRATASGDPQGPAKLFFKPPDLSASAALSPQRRAARLALLQTENKIATQRHAVKGKKRSSSGRSDRAGLGVGKVETFPPLRWR